MANPFNGSQRGKRGNNPFRDSRKSQAVQDLLEDRAKGTSMTALIGEKIILCADTPSEVGGIYIEETVESHLIPRKSLSVKQHLALFPQDVETVPMIKRQLVTNPSTGEITVVTTTDERPIWKSDRTLLTRNRPEKVHGLAKRQTSQSKRIVMDRDNPTEYDNLITETTEDPELGIK